jgi:hypothetical protein
MAVSMVVAFTSRGGTPRIACDDPVYDFGIVSNTASVKHSFTIRNDGDAPLLISEVRRGCGCLLSSLSKVRLDAGESESVDVELLLKDRTGRQDKSVYIHSNDPVRPVLCLRMVSEIVRDVEMEPPHLVFSMPAEIRQGWKDVMLRAGTGRSFKVLRVSIDDPEFFRAEMSDVDPGRLYRLRVSLTDAGKKPGAAGTTMAVVTTDNPEYSRIEVPLSTSVPEEIVVAPSRLILRRRSAGPPDKRALLVHSPYSGLLGVSIVSYPAEGAQGRVRKLPDGRFRVDIENIPPIADAAQRELVLSVDRDDGRSETVKVPVLVE